MNIHTRNTIAKCLFYIVLMNSLNAYAQTQRLNTDSLKQVLTKAKTDTDRVNCLIWISGSIDCMDSINKMRYANKALDLATSIKWQEGMCLANIRIGKTYGDCMHNYPIASKYFLQAVSIAKAADDEIDEAKALNFIANSYLFTNQYRNALDYYKQALELNTDLATKMGGLGNVGFIYNKMGDYPTALIFYDSSLKILDESIRSSKKSERDDTLQMAGLLITIGEIYLSMSEYERALANFDKARNIGLATRTKVVRLWALMGIAKTCQLRNEPAKAIENYQNALSVSKEIGQSSEESDILNRLGNVYLETGELTKALPFAQNSRKIAEENDITAQLPQTYTTLGGIYTKLKKYNDAINYLQNAIALCQKSGALDDEKNAWDALSKAYEAMGQPAKSLDAYKHFITIRDSVYNISKANELTRIDLQSTFSREKIVDSAKQAGEYKMKIQKQKAYTFSGYIGFVLVLLLSFFIYRNYSVQKKANVLISKAHEEVKLEKQVSENLLLNILPEAVADELKQKGGVKAKLFDNVTVMFTDFVNFTFAGERFSPQELVAELHTCFVAFDEILGKYDVEKIKTIGDAYMAVSGLPRANECHASEVIKAAIEIRDYMIARKKLLGDKTFDIRIGINSGTVVAGIVGVKKFAYDIWGDAVNVAARMEQYGEPGKINISQSTYDLVKDEFTCTDRGELDAKHKGKMRMYFAEA